LLCKIVIAKLLKVDFNGSFFSNLGSPFRNVLTNQQLQTPIEPQTTPLSDNDHIVNFERNRLPSNLLIFNSQSLNNIALSDDTIYIFTGINQEPRVLFNCALSNTNNQSTPNSFQSALELSN
jgi:hypothetical protein